MAQVQITDVVVPAEFTAYQVENSMFSTALYQSGVALPNGEMHPSHLNAFHPPQPTPLRNAPCRFTVRDRAAHSTPSSGVDRQASPPGNRAERYGRLHCQS
jgi:hypothetical protein